METLFLNSRSTGRLLLLFCSLLFMPCSQADDSLKLGIHPYKSPASLLKMYQPLADIISDYTGKPVEIVISRDYAEHIQQTGADKFDIAYLGPASYVSMVAQHGKKPILARQAINDKPTFQGKIIIRADSSIQTIKDLKGKRFAFGDPNSTMSHLVPRYMLIEQGVTAEQLQQFDFLNSHDNVALAILTGDFDAGAVKEAVYEKYKPRGIKALASTPALSEHLFVSSKKLPADLVAGLRQLFLTLNKSNKGRNAMHSIKSSITRFMPANDADYDNLRTILTTLKKHKVSQ